MGELKSSLVIQAVDKYSGPAEKIAKSNSVMASALGRTHKELLKIGQERSSIARLQKYSAATKIANSTAAEAAKRVKTLREAKVLEGQSNRVLNRQLKKAEAAQKAANNQRRLAVERSSKLRTKLKAEGLETRDLAKANKRLGEQYAATQAKAKALGDAHGKLIAAQGKVRQSQQQAANMTIVAAGASRVGRGAVNSLVDPGQAAISFESAMTEVGKFVKGADIPKLSQQILELGNNSPLGSEGIAKLVAAGGKLNLVADDALKFATETEQWSVSMGLSVDSASEKVATLKAGMNLSMGEMSLLGDAINHLGDNSESNAPNIVDILTRVGGLGKAAGLANPQIAALAAVIDGAAPSAEIAATGMKNILQTLSGGEQLAEAKRKMLEDLGFDATDIAQRMQENAVATTREILQSIADRDAAERSGITEELFGRESVAAVLNLVGNLEGYDKAMGEVADTSLFVGSKSREYQREMEKTATRVAVLKERFTNLKINLGNQLMPTISKLITAGEWAVDMLGRFASAFPTATKAGLLLVGGLGALAVVVAPLIVGALSLKVALAQLNVMLAKTAATAAAATLGGGVGGGKLSKVGGFFKGSKFLKGAGALTAILGAVNIASTLASDNPEINKGHEVSKTLGSTSGAVIGGALGSFIPIPVVGTLLGTVVGGMIGDWLGDKAGDALFSGDSNNGATAVASASPVSALPAGVDNRTFDNSQVTFHVTQQPGENIDELAERIDRKIASRKARRRNSSFSDDV